MQPARQRKLLYLIICACGLALICALVLYALGQNINLFYSPSQLLENKTVKPNQAIRIGGMVVKNSVLRKPDSLQTVFQLTDYKQTLLVRYEGILPTLFREGQGIVAKGRLQEDGTFKASEVLAKHDENYMPSEVKSALQAGGSNGR